MAAPIERYTVEIPETAECSAVTVKRYQSGDISLRQGDDFVYLDGDQVRAFLEIFHRTEV
jgi:hypothetical protein